MTLRNLVLWIILMTLPAGAGQWMAAIELHWKLPGKADFSVIPAEAYAHEPASAGAS